MDLQSRLFGFKFENDDEASQFSQAVTLHIKPKRKSLPIPSHPIQTYLTLSVTFVIFQLPLDKPLAHAHGKKTLIGGGQLFSPQS